MVVCSMQCKLKSLKQCDLNRANIRMHVDVHVHSAIMKVAGKRNASTM